MSPEQITERVGAIVDGLDEVWTLVSDLIAEMQTTQEQLDACHDLDLVELRALLGKTSSELWRKKLPYVLAEHFSPEPDPDAQRDAMQDRAMREAWGE
jgi:hypothetical protein